MTSNKAVLLSGREKARLERNLYEVEKFLSRKFPKFSVAISLFALALILVLVYRHEDEWFSVLLKIATIFPLTLIVVLLRSYFWNRRKARHIQSYYTGILNTGAYEALRVTADACETYRDALYTYFLFKLKDGRSLLLRANDFSFDKTVFPNDDFLVPPWELSDVAGNQIICDGNPISVNENPRIDGLLASLGSLPKGQVSIIRHPDQKA